MGTDRSDLSVMFLIRHMVHLMVEARVEADGTALVILGV